MLICNRVVAADYSPKEWHYSIAEKIPCQEKDGGFSRQKAEQN